MEAFGSNWESPHVIAQKLGDKTLKLSIVDEILIPWA